MNAVVAADAMGGAGAEAGEGRVRLPVYLGRQAQREQAAAPSPQQERLSGL